MDRSNVLTLISVQYTKDSINQLVPEEVKREVFCGVSSLSRTEWLDAGQMGLKPECKATMFAPDYNGESIAELNGVRYSIYRTYIAANEQIELYLERKAGV